MNNYISCNNLSYRYESLYALSGITLDITKGDSVAVVGPNGSGKSTLLKIFNAICFSTEGEYYFEGEKINEKRMKDGMFSKKFHKKIGFVFQNSDAQLFCPSVYEEIAFGPRQMGMNNEEVDERVYDCLKLLNIEHLKNREPYHLSEGEKKKLAIAAVLALNPDVLTLDEPMNNLDHKTKEFLQSLLMKINRAGENDYLCNT